MHSTMIWTALGVLALAYGFNGAPFWLWALTLLVGAFGLHAPIWLPWKWWPRSALYVIVPVIRRFFGVVICGK